jgi:hypothetical protein
MRVCVCVWSLLGALDALQEPARAPSPAPTAAGATAAAASAAAGAATASTDPLAQVNMADMLRQLGLGDAGGASGSGGEGAAPDDVVRQMEAAFRFMQENPDFARTLQALAEQLPEDLRTLTPTHAQSCVHIHAHMYTAVRTHMYTHTYTYTHMHMHTHQAQRYTTHAGCGWNERKGCTDGLGARVGV